MRPARTWQREARLLLIVAELTDGGPATPWADVVAIDFLMQHPSLLAHLAEDWDWPADALTSRAEIESSEEALLHWKRSVELSLVGPMLGRLIGRGLLSQTSGGSLSLTTEGARVAKELRPRYGAPQNVRLRALAEAFLGGLPTSRSWLPDALAEEIS